MMTVSKPRLWPGQPYPLGATWDGTGVNFALFSEHATGVELCLFDAPESALARERLELRERTDLVWHGYVPGLGPGQLYYDQNADDVLRRWLTVARRAIQTIAPAFSARRMVKEYVALYAKAAGAPRG